MRCLLVFLALLASPLQAQDYVSAVLEPSQMAEMRATVSGRIADIHVVEGQVLKAGTLIAQMDSGVQDARVSLSSLAATSTGQSDRATALVAQAQALLDRVTQARSRGAAQEWEVNQAEQAVKVALADLTIAIESEARAAAQLELERAMLAEFQVRAPFDGTVLQIFKEPGEIISTQDIVVEFGNLHTLEATAFFPVEALSQVEIGQALNGIVDTGALQSDVRLAVSAIEPRIDPASRTFRVTLALPNGEHRHTAGSTLLIPLE